eukprot:8539389-Alexandrium_andersonii.AAC.1
MGNNAFPPLRADSNELRDLSCAPLQATYRSAPPPHTHKKKRVLRSRGAQYAWTPPVCCAGGASRGDRGNCHRRCKDRKPREVATPTKREGGGPRRTVSTACVVAVVNCSLVPFGGMKNGGCSFH